ncbi:MAG: GNAT family N-acetyltransferase [Aggregatilineales bacterium]
MTNYIHRNYQTDADLYAMQAMTAESIQQVGICGHLHIGDIPHRIFNDLRREDPKELVWLWHDLENHLAGYVIVCPAHKGFDLHIHPVHRAGTLESEMIAYAVAQTRQKMAESKIEGDIGTDVDECDDVRMKRLEEAGFVRGKQLYWFTERNLGVPILKSTLQEGFFIRSAEGVHEAQKLIDVHSSGFGSSWTLAQYERVMTSPGYDAERELVVVAPDGQFAAFCIIWLDENNKIGYFEPVGVHKDFHRRGLGSALMNHAMRIMIDKDMETATVLHEVDNPASTGLYASLGFKQMYRIFEYTLDSKVSG